MRAPTGSVRIYRDTIRCRREKPILSSDITTDEYQALAEFRFRLRRFLHFSEQAARAVGLEPQQHQLLLALRGYPAGQPATVGDLAERLLLHHHSTVELIDRSARQGFVERQRDEADRRRVLIRLTPAGEAVLRDLSVHHRAELRSAGPALVRALNALLVGAAVDEEDPVSHPGHDPPRGEA